MTFSHELAFPAHPFDKWFRFHCYIFIFDCKITTNFSYMQIYLQIARNFKHSKPLTIVGANNKQLKFQNIMNNFNELEQLLYAWLKTNALPKQINQDLILDFKKVFNRYIPLLHKAANKCKKNPTGWTTDALNIDKNWFNRHQWE